MLKKIVACVLFSVGSSVAVAGSPYVGLGVGALNVPNYFGVLGKIFAGYGASVGPCCDYYVGGELFANGYDYRNDCHCHGHHHTNHKFYSSVGASFLPGVMINPCTMVFGRIGLAQSTTNYNNHHRRHSNYSRTGGQLGLGMQSFVTPNWALRGEYIYTGCGVFNNFGRYRSNEIDASLIYKFC